MKKPALGKGVEALFEITKPEELKIKEPRVTRVPKFRTFEVKLSILLRQDQLDFLSKLEREIMSHRSPHNKIERITKNSIIRAYIDALKCLEINTKEIPNEAELLKRIKILLK